ncbi:MAG TPA: tRNA (guanosine(46)-N7)-methyltransferase TrmB [Bacilli bacterium]|nr:tRNA (guanosine(46)-N7)-methyltransferase TrmB [Bacilli bacterium]
MRLRNVKNSHVIINSSKYVIQEPETYKGKWNKVFNNNNLINIEIGMGKGDFIITLALNNPNINYIGIEKYTSVIVRAVQKLEKLEINNLKLINIDAMNIENIFSKEINLIYINFSDPWPKKRHEERRLTSSTFLGKYEKIFKNKKTIYQKTDNENLFIYSLESLSKYGYILNNISFDLHNSNIINSAMTEYEKKFLKESKKIYYLEAYKD